jgi:NADP-dependent 3-hydroxy acid dehydrogenase YdfG
VPVTLITGGASGIGAASARALLDAGHQVAITGRDPDRLAAFADQAGQTDRLLTVAGDSTVDKDVTAAVAATLDRFGALTNVVANAGFSTHDSLADGDPDGWRDMVLVNVLAPALLVRAALPALSTTAGSGLTARIVFIGSVAGIKNTPGNVYSVTKWATTGLAENTRLMVTAQGIGVTLVAPGRVDTPFWDARRSNGRLEGPVLTAEDVARTVVWCLSQPAGVDVNTVVVRPVGQVN